MTPTDEELRALIPAHDDVPIRYPDALGHLTLADEELIDQLAKDYAAQHALATARAVWAAAIERAKLRLEITMISDIHSCSYYCDRPECIRRQRDELRDAVPDGMVLVPREPTHVTGPGHIEGTGYIPACSAKERVASPAVAAPQEPVRPEDYSAFSNLAMLVKRLVHRYRQLDPHDPISDDVMKFLRECGGMGNPFRASPVVDAPAAEPVATVRDPYDTNGMEWHCRHPPRNGTKLYTHPLTDAAIRALQEKP